MLHGLFPATLKGAFLFITMIQPGNGTIILHAYKQLTSVGIGEADNSLGNIGEDSLDLARFLTPRRTFQRRFKFAEMAFSQLNGVLYPLLNVENFTHIFS